MINDTSLYLQKISQINEACTRYRDSAILNSSNIAQTQNSIKNLEAGIQKSEIASAILSKSSSSVRAIAKIKMEEIVTKALQFVTQDSTIKFIIDEIPTKSKPSYEFYVETIVNGQPSKQKPEDSCGGGFIDIIAVTLKYAYLELYNEPAIMNDSFPMDEPGKMISEQIGIKFAEYIKFLGGQFGKQTIMITHNENLANVADTTFIVSKNQSGISKVVKYSPTAVNANLNEVLQELEETTDA